MIEGRGVSGERRARDAEDSEYVFAVCRCQCSSPIPHLR